MNLNGESNVLDNLPERIEGWLNVLDVPASGDLSLISDKTRHLQWRPLYCVLRISSHRLSHSRSEDRTIQKRSQSASILRIEGTLDELLKSSETLNHSHRDDDLDSKERNLFSFGIGNSLEDNPTNRFISFINRTSSQIKGNLRRTRSSSKLDRRKLDETSIDAGSATQGNFLKRTRSFGRLSKRLQSKWKGVQDRNESSEKEKSLRTAQSHESLVCHQPIINLTTLNSNTDIRVIHNPLILMKENCFLITTDKVSRFYSCSNSRQMFIWLKYLKQSLDKIRRKEFRNLKSISILISEAKNLSNKLRYFCELTIDGQVYGRTTTKAKGDMLFWGEEFHFRNLPTMMEKGGKLMINIFQDIEKKKKKHNLSILIGCVSLQLSDLNSGLAQEKWFPVRLMSDKNHKEAVSIRIRLKYQSINVLPFEFYSPLLNHMEHNYSIIVSEFEQLLSAKDKEEFGILMVNIFRAIQKSEKFLVDIIMAEVNKQEKIQTLLRSNSIASKSIDSFMKLVSEKYLKSVLGNFISSLMDPNLNLEVDNIPSGHELHKRQEKFLRVCNSACSHIFTSRPDDDETCFPKELKQVFTSLKKRLLLEGFNDNTINQVISSCFFLRFICPAIMSPSLFCLTRSLPQDKEARNCTLVAKAIQGLANFTRFGEGKEESMIFLNEFVEAQTPNLKRFINDISDFSGDVKDTETIKVEIGLDLSHDLSLLHLFLKDALEKKFTNEQMKFNEIVKLFPILTELDESYNQWMVTSKLDGSADSLNDLPLYEEDGLARRRTMREIHESGSYISFTSLQNISEQASGNGFNVPSNVPRLTSNSDIDRFSVSSSRASRISEKNTSSSCLDIKHMNMKAKEKRTNESLDSTKSDKQTFTTLLSQKSIAELDANLQNTFREMHTIVSPQRAVYAAETEIDCCDDAVTSWKPLTPQGNLIDYPNGKLQIIFDLPKQDDFLTHRSHFVVSSLKRPSKDQQRPLIFSNPGFGLKSSLSQTSLKIEANSPNYHSMNTKNTLMFSDCELVASDGEILVDQSANTENENKSVNMPSSLELISLKANTNQLSQDSAIQASKNARSPGDSSFSGRGDIGFNIKSSSQSLCKVSWKSNGNKDTDGQILAQKSQVADLKWMLQQEREARSRMEAEYERKLRISEHERKKMEIKAFEDKKLIDILQKQIKEDREKAAELEKQLSDSISQLQAKVNKVAKKWPNSMSENI